MRPVPAGRELHVCGDEGAARDDERAGDNRSSADHLAAPDDEGCEQHRSERSGRGERRHDGDTPSVERFEQRAVGESQDKAGRSERANNGRKSSEASTTLDQEVEEDECGRREEGCGADDQWFGRLSAVAARKRLSRVANSPAQRRANATPSLRNCSGRVRSRAIKTPPKTISPVSRRGVEDGMARRAASKRSQPTAVVRRP